MKRRQSGFLLMEALVSLFLLTLGCVAAWESFSLARAAQKRSDVEARVFDCAQEKMAAALSRIEFSPVACEGQDGWNLTARAVPPDMEAVTGRNGDSIEFETMRFTSPRI